MSSFYVRDLLKVTERGHMSAFTIDDLRWTECLLFSKRAAGEVDTFQSKSLVNARIQLVRNIT